MRRLLLGCFNRGAVSEYFNAVEFELSFTLGSDELHLVDVFLIFNVLWRTVFTEKGEQVGELGDSAESLEFLVRILVQNVVNNGNQVGHRVAGPSRVGLNLFAFPVEE